MIKFCFPHFLGNGQVSPLSEIGNAIWVCCGKTSSRNGGIRLAKEVKNVISKGHSVPVVPAKKSNNSKRKHGKMNKIT